jgi:hypothetical protein
MKTLIIPCAGKSSRFQGMQPKWLLKYPDGDLMVKKSIMGLPLHEFDRIIVTAVKEHVEKYDVERVLKESFGDFYFEKFELCILDEFTSCQSETVYQTIKKCNVTSSFAVKDSDNYIKMNLIDNECFVAGIDMQKFPKEIERLSAKSFLMINDQGAITDIIEKKIVSQYISIGMYGFNDAALFCEAFEHLAQTRGIKNEIFLSHVISYLIGTRKCIYSYIEADDYEDWGTKKDWYSVLNVRRTYIINAEDVLIDSTKLCDGEDYVFDKNNVDTLRKLSEVGAQIILLTCMNEKQSVFLETKLADFGIKIHETISGCYRSHQTLIKGFSAEIPYPACESINIRVGEKIGDVIENER